MSATPCTSRSRAVVGQALLLGQLGLLLYPAAFWLIAAAFVRWYEEPALTRRFGADYEAYRRGARLVAPPAPLEAQRARRTGRAVTHRGPKSARWAMPSRYRKDRFRERTLV